MRWCRYLFTSAENNTTGHQAFHLTLKRACYHNKQQWKLDIMLLNEADMKLDMNVTPTNAHTLLVRKTPPLQGRRGKVCQLFTDRKDQSTRGFLSKPQSSSPVSSMNLISAALISQFDAAKLNFHLMTSLQSPIWGCFIKVNKYQDTVTTHLVSVLENLIISLILQ